MVHVQHVRLLGNKNKKLWMYVPLMDFQGIILSKKVLEMEVRFLVSSVCEGEKGYRATERRWACYTGAV